MILNLLNSLNLLSVDATKYYFTNRIVNDWLTTAISSTTQSIVSNTHRRRRRDSIRHQSRRHRRCALV